jgi:signal transduction histidine kinase
LTYVVPLLLVISLSMVGELFATLQWTAWPGSPVSSLPTAVLAMAFWTFAFVPAIIGAAAVVPFYPSGESLAWRLAVAFAFSLMSALLRIGAEYAVAAPLFVSGAVFLEIVLSLFVPFSCIAVSMYLAQSHVRSLGAQRDATELKFLAKQDALEQENAELRVRREMSAVLHDKVQQRLVFAASRLEGEVVPIALANDDTVAANLLREIIADIDRLREEDVRRLSHSLFPAGADLSLGAAVRLAISRVPAAVAVDLNFSERAADFDTVAEPELHLAARAVLVGLLEEAITNAIKHADTTSLTVKIDLLADGSDRVVVLTIANDGKPVDGVVRLSGLAVYQERLEARGGGLELGLDDQGRTEVTGWLPAPQGLLVDQAMADGASRAGHPSALADAATADSALPDQDGSPEQGDPGR